MGIPAIPDYLNRHLSGGESPPGHRFGLYFPVWNQDWSIQKDKKKEALGRVLQFGRSAAALLKNIRARQEETAAGLQGVFRIEAKSSSPFVTGVGMEHPVENGFAFLSPYGLPYLPGSGVKGVLRKAAEELALMKVIADRHGWDMITLWRLFGFEAASASLGATGKMPRVKPLTDMSEERKVAFLAATLELGIENVQSFMKEVLPSKKRESYNDDPYAFLTDLINDKKLRESLSYRGALSFWDVFPEPPDHKLGVDILNPHHTKYYQDGMTPADCESPVPNFFLVVPPETDFVFHVQCEANRLPEELQAEWQKLLQAAFDHAFDWLGFGAKTAVGYGQFNRDNNGDCGTPPIAPSPAPEKARQDKLESFRKGLPRVQDLPSRMEAEIGKIQSETDESIRREMCQALLDLAHSDAKRFKRAVKEDKQWARKLTDLCLELRVG